MSEEKNIDRLFQEKLKDYEVAPSASVWKNIKSRLNHKKKKRRVIPLWLRLSGVAAGLLLLFMIGNSAFKTDNFPGETENNSLVDTEKDEKQELKTTKDNHSSPKENQIINDLNSLNDNKKDVVNQFNKVLNEIQLVSDDNNNLVVDNLSSVEDNTSNNPKWENNIVQERSLIMVDSEKGDTNSIKSVTAVTDSQNEINDIKKLNQLSEDDKESITEAIATSENPEEILKEDKKEYKKWRIATNLAPVYFNTLGKGSSIHSEFNDNPKSGDVNMSYGLTASYAVNNKISIRSGVSKVNLGYSTNNIFVFNSLSSSIRSSKFQNIELNNVAEDMSFLSPSSFNAQIPQTLVQKNTSLNQQIGFIEVPLELEYKLIDKKLGVHVIGGFSALFLESNDIYSVVDGQSTLIGEATNINKMSYSANLGLGLNYKMSQKFNLNLEPVFKYQINTFNNTSGDFRPYFIGFYTGLSFKF